MDVLLLPGIIAPAAIRYAPLLAELDGVDARTKDLDVYAGDEPPAAYSIQREVDAVAAFADAAGADRFHLYGHSGGGAVALAFAAAHPGRVRTLAVDEPASDHTDADHADPYWQEIGAAAALPPAEATAAFLRLQVAADVELPAPPPGPPPLWMTTRPRGIAAFVAALPRHRVDAERYRSIDVPVLFTRGSRTHPRWAVMDERLAGLFPRYTSVVFDGLHHLNTSHQAEPARVAALLTSLWGSA